MIVSCETPDLFRREADKTPAEPKPLKLVEKGYSAPVFPFEASQLPRVNGGGTIPYAPGGGVGGLKIAAH